jgi:hypothetical protein
MKLARLGLALAVGLFPLAGCGPQVPPMGTYSTVYGQVTDATTNAPIAGATVTINGTLEATTDNSGNYRAYPVPSGPFEYFASAPGYQTSPTNTSASPLAPGEQRNILIQLSRS